MLIRRRFGVRISVAAFALLAAGWQTGPTAGGAQAQETRIMTSTGQAIPVSRIVFDHPARAAAMPVSKELWEAGNRVHLYHCNYMDAKGRLSEITLQGVMLGYNEALQQIAPVESLNRAFGGYIKPGELRAANGDVEKLARLFVEAIWKKAGGNAQRAAALLRQAEQKDADCARRFIGEINTTAALLQQGMVMVRDGEGAPMVVRGVTPSSEMYRGTIQLAATQAALNKRLIPVYRSAASVLSQRAARAADMSQVAKPAPQPDPKPQPARPAPPVLPATYQPVELQKVDAEFTVVIGKLRDLCLVTASIDRCT